jgi:hypothetical protein
MTPSEKIAFLLKCLDYHEAHESGTVEIRTVNGWTDLRDVLESDD